MEKRYKIPNLKIDSKLKLNHLKKVLKQNLSGYDQLIFESNCEPKIIINTKGNTMKIIIKNSELP